MWPGPKDKAEFLNDSLLDVWSGRLFAVKSAPPHCRVFRGVFALYALDVNKTPRLWK